MRYIVRFGPENRIRDLIERGRVWMNAVGTFSTLSDDLARGDPDEALVRRYSPATAQAVAELGDTSFPLPLAGPLRVWRTEDRKRAIYCLHGIADLKQTIDPRLFDFGEWIAFFTNGDEFIRRVRSAASEAGHELAFKPVGYVPASHSGAMDIFTKPEKFQHQQEWRLVSRDPVPEGRLILTLGPLHDVARLVSRAELVGSD